MIGHHIMMSLLLLFASCSLIDEKITEPELPNQSEEAEDLYLTLTLSLPQTDAATRGNSSTETDGSSSDDTLGGEENENVLNSASLYLYELDVNNKYKVVEKLTEDTGTKASDVTYRFTYKMAIETIKKYAGKKLGMVIVGNEGEDSGLMHDLTGYTATNDKNVFEAGFLITSVNSKPLGYFEEGKKKGQIMPLVNKSGAEIDFSRVKENASNKEILDALSQRYSHTNNTFYITPVIELERAVARIDYADGSNDNDFTYTITSTKKNEKDTGVKVKLYKMELFNVNPSSYLFRHTAAGTIEKRGNQVDLFGIENGKENNTPNTYTWIVTSKSESLLNGFDISALSIDNEKEEPLSFLILSEDFGSRYKYSARERNYYPWCYVSENALSSIEDMKEGELEDKATGVLFTFQVLGEDGDLLKYSPDKKNYPGGITNSSTPGVKEGTITITDQNKYWLDVEPSNGGYFLKYPAFIKHNDLNPGSNNIDPMEYAVVRNNVYQLCVTGVTKLYNPKEPLGFYLDVDIRVLSWVKHDVGVQW